MRTGTVQFFIVFLVSSRALTHSRYSRDTGLMKEPSFKSGERGGDKCYEDQSVDVDCLEGTVAWGLNREGTEAEGGRRGRGVNS